jgi:hypothetical protein
VTGALNQREYGGEENEMYMWRRRNVLVKWRIVLMWRTLMAAA